MNSARKCSLDLVSDTFLVECRAHNLSPLTIEHCDWAIRNLRATLPSPPAAQVLADVQPDASRAWVTREGHVDVDLFALAGSRRRHRR